MTFFVSNLFMSDKKFTSIVLCLGRLIIAKEMPRYGQFHQHFTRAFCANIFGPKNYKAKHN